MSISKAGDKAPVMVTDGMTDAVGSKLDPQLETWRP